MIHLYKNINTNYNKNGDFLFDIEATILKELSGSYTATINTEYTDKFGLFNVGMVFKVKDNTINQLFRINSININNGIINISALHIYTDLLDYHIDKILINNMTRLNALNYSLNNTIFNNNIGENRFTISPLSVDNPTIKDLEINNDNILHLINTEGDNTIKGLYGGEFDFDNFNIIYKDKIGEDRGYFVADGKNLENFEQDINCTDVITRIMPETSDGLRIDNLYIDSPNINNYNKIYFAKIIFDEVKFDVLPPEEQDASYNTRKREAQEKLIELTNNLYTKNKVDIPKVTYNISLEDLRYNRKYNKIAHLLNLELGDTIKIKNSRLNINLTQRVVSTIYISGAKGIEGKYTEITLANLQDKFTSSYSKEKSTISNNSGNNEGLSGRVEDLEKGFSEFEQKWDNIEFRFATSSINRIKNGAFIKNLDFWTSSNAAILDTEEQPFIYKRVNKDADFQTSALKITNNLSKDELNKAFSISDIFELKTNRNYTFSFKIKLDSNVESAQISLIKKINEDDEEVQEQIVNIFRGTGNKFINEKFFVDFKTDDINKYYRVKITHNGLISTLNMEDNNSVVTTELMLCEGFGYKPFDYNDAIYQGITTIDANGVLVKHSSVGTMSRMAADGFKILDNAGNILGSFGTEAEYVNLYADKVYATNVKQSIINKDEHWKIENELEPWNDNSYKEISFYNVLTDVFKCAKNRMNSVLEIIDNRNYRDFITDRIEIEDFDGSDVNIDLADTWYTGDIVIKNCTSKVTINGTRPQYRDSQDGTKFSGAIIIENCTNIIIKNIWLQSLDTGLSQLKVNVCLDIKNSKVLISNCNITEYFYLGESQNSDVTFDYVTGRVLMDLNCSNTKLWIGKNEDSDDMYLPITSLSGNYGQGSAIIKCGNGQVIRKEISAIEENKPPLFRWFNNTVSNDWGDYQAFSFEKNSKQWIPYDENEKLIQGYMKFEDEIEQDWLGAFKIGLDSAITSYLSSENPTFTIEEVKLKFRLKTKSFSSKEFNIGFCTFKGTMNMEDFQIVDNYGVIGTAKLVKDNYITLNNKIIYKLVNNEIEGFAFNITDKDNKECIFIDARSLNMIVITKDESRI